ncbi:MAG: 3D domain-containing protein [Dissulfuribacterales bacterium]
MSKLKSRYIIIFFIILFAGLYGCGKGKVIRKMEVTAYCGCGECCNWERGRWLYLKLDFWNKYISKGKYEGRPYSGLTASGTKPHEPQPGLFSLNSIAHFWMIPFRIIFPWLWFSHDGTIAADTRYYKFGTRMYVPGYGYGIIEDRGGAIKGPTRLDLFYSSHSEALKWGRKHINVTIYK